MIDDSLHREGARPEGLRFVLLHALPFAALAALLAGAGFAAGARWCAMAGTAWVALVVFRRLRLLRVERDRERAQRRTWQDRAETLGAVLEVLPAAVMAAEPEGKILIYNPACEAMLGLGPSDAPVAEWAATYGVFHADATTPYVSNELPFVRAMRGEAVDETDILIRNERNSGTWISAFSRPVRDAGGELRAGVLLCHDVTQRREAEAEIRRLNADLERRVRERTASLEAALARLEAEAGDKERISGALLHSRKLFQDIVDNAPAIIFIKDLEGHYLMVAPQWETDLGIARELTLGRSDADLFPADMVEELRRNDLRVVAEDRPLQFEEVVLTPTGLRTFISLKFPLRDADGPTYGVCGIATDITERKRMEAELRCLEELARRNQAELTHVLRLGTLGEIASGLAHEINQPLGAIANFAGACGRLLETSFPHARELRRGLDLIAAEALRAGEIIRRLRDLGRKGEGQIESLDLNAVVRRAAELMQPEIRLQGISFHLDTGDALPQIYADGIQIEQVLLNLLLNAIESMQGSEIKRLDVRTDGSNGIVRVTIRDTGSGFDPRSSDRLFEPFYTTKQKGLGMGLAISHRIIEAHGGRLWGAPNHDRGSSFAFSLPAARG